MASGHGGIPSADPGETSIVGTMSARLNLDEITVIMQYLEHMTNHGDLPKGYVTKAAKIFKLSRQTVSKYWNIGETSKGLGLAVNLQPQYHKSGRHAKHVETEKVPEIPLEDRTNQRDMASALHTLASTINRLIKKEEIKPHTNPLRPGISPTNVRQRLIYCLNMIVPSTIYSNPTFKPFYDYVHIDEKWFYLTKTTSKCT